MNLTILNQYEACCQRIAEEMARLIAIKPEALLCLAAGHSSLGVFDAMVEMQQKGAVDFSKVYIVGLDEWTGKGKEDDGSCAGFLYRNCFDRLPIPSGHIRLFNGFYQDAAEECRQVEAYIGEHGCVDYMLLGMGMNGHLGLNEPGTSFDSGAHETALSETTKRVGQKYFHQKTELSGGITLGIRTILNSRRIALIVNGANKREAFARFMAADVDEAFPASVIKQTPHAEIFADWACAQGISGLR